MTDKETQIHPNRFILVLSLIRGLRRANIKLVIIVGQDPFKSMVLTLVVTHLDTRRKTAYRKKNSITSWSGTSGRGDNNLTIIVQ